jgi:hypothetical protein
MNGLKWLTCAAIVAGVLGAREARADIALGGDVDVAVPIDAAGPPALRRSRYVSTGAGFDLRVGYRFIIPYRHIAITPELAGGYTNISSQLFRLRPGVRVGFGRLFVPYAYGHIGWGWTTFDPLGNDNGSMDSKLSGSQGASFDFGAGLDITVARRFTIGGHIGYNVVNVGQLGESSKPATFSPGWAAKWMNFGLQATFYL